MRNVVKVFIVLSLMIFSLSGCSEKNLDKYNEIIDKSNKVLDYQYKESVEYGVNNLEMTKTVCVSKEFIKSTFNYADNLEDELTTYLDLKNNKSYLYYKNLNTAMETPIQDSTLREFLIPFSKINNLGDLKEEEIVSITEEQIEGIDTNKVVIQSEENGIVAKVEIWYSKEYYLPIRFNVYNNENLVLDGEYELLSINKIDDELLKLPKDVIIQGFELPVKSK